MRNEQGTDTSQLNPRAEPENQNKLADGINEYLRSLNLVELSEQEMEQVSQNESGLPPLLLNGPEDKPSEVQPEENDDSREQPQSSSARQRSRRKSRFRPGMPSFGFGLDPLSSLALAGNIIQFVDFAAKVSYNVANTYLNVQDAPRELLMLSKRIMQYSGLLKTAAEVIRTSMPAGELQRLGWEVVRDSEEAMEGVQHILEKYGAKPGRKFGAAISALKWTSNRKHVLAVMEEVESLKSTLSVMLQTHQIQMTERNFEAIKLATEEASLSLRRQMGAKANGDAPAF